MPSQTSKTESQPAAMRKKQKAGEVFLRLLLKDLAATYSRGSYTTTTIGKTVFDGRVRNGIGSDHSFMATKKCLRTATASFARKWVSVLTDGAKFQKSVTETDSVIP